MKLKDLLAGLNYRFMEGMDCPDYDKDISALCFDGGGRFCLHFRD